MEYLRPLVHDLLRAEKHEMVFEILDMHYARAQTMADFDVLGSLSLKAEHRKLYLKCAEAGYAMAESTIQKYLARTNLYKAYNAMNYPEKAMFYIRMNLSLDPNDFETLCQEAFTYSLMGNKDKGDAMLLEILKKHPDKEDKLRSTLSGLHLREGRTAKGILSFLNSDNIKSNLFTERLGMRLWDGLVRPGQTIYVEGAGGIGDEIINIRFFDKLRAFGMRPILYSSWHKYRGDTVDLFRRHGYEVITDAYTIDPRAYWCPMLHLPGFMNLTEADLWNGPYLTPQKDPSVDLGKKRKLRIGIKCSGNPYFSQNEYRVIPVHKMLDYLPGPDEAEIYYIDKSDKPEGVESLSDRINSWEDTLDILDQMDLVVSSCTSIVHASGAMGKPTMVIVPIVEYYVWTTTSKTTRSPWYGDNFFVFKQTKLRSWDEPLEKMREYVNTFMNGGELVHG